MSSSSTTSATSTPTLLFLGLPTKTFVGIDLITFNSSPHFQGISHLPPGFHLLYTGTDPSLSIRHGHWFCIGPGSVGNSRPLTWQWDHEDESLKLLPNDELELVQQPSSSRGLVDYSALQDATKEQKAKQARLTDPSSDLAKEDPSPSWDSLTTHVSNGVLDRILSSASDVTVNSTTRQKTWHLTSLTSTSSDAEATANQVPGLTPAEVLPILTSSKYSGDSNIHLLPIDLSRTFPSASTGATRTAAARDRSWYLSHLIDGISTSTLASSIDTANPREVGASHLLGELQVTFLAVLTLSNYTCLEGWKRILDVLLTCSTALTQISQFFVRALRILRAQVSMFDDVEGGLFELSDEGGGAWLRKLLRRFRGAVDEATASVPGEGTRELNDELSSLETTMRTRYGWDDVGGSILRRGKIQLEDGEEVEVAMEGLDEEEETGEWAPVVVDLE